MIFVTQRCKGCVLLIFRSYSRILNPHVIFSFAIQFLIKFSRVDKNQCDVLNESEKQKKFLKKIDKSDAKKDSIESNQ